MVIAMMRRDGQTFSTTPTDDHDGPIRESTTANVSSRRPEFLMERRASIYVYTIFRAG